MSMRTIATLAAFAVMAGTAHPQAQIFGFDGSAPGVRFAESVGVVGDFNNDGYDDVIVGASFDDSAGDNAGIARVYSGKDGAVLFSVTGFHPGDWMGLSVAGAGDVNNDGYADVIVGAPGYDAAGTNSGKAYVYSGKTSGLLWSFTAGAAFDHFGQSVAGAGDVNADGYDDLLVGAPQEGNGTVRVYSGKTGAIIWTWGGDVASDALGHSVNGAGDVNGDGYSDVIAGAPFSDVNGTDSGYARVFSGRTGAMLWNFIGAPGSEMGRSVDGAGDWNGDGFDDLVVGAPSYDLHGVDSGRVYVQSGFSGSTLRYFDGPAADDRLGAAVAGCGDVTGSGEDCIIVGAPGDFGGTVRIYKHTGLVYSFDGVYEFAAAVDGGGDFNKDGKADFIVGDPAYNIAGADRGRAYVYISSNAWAWTGNYGAGWPGTQGVPTFTASALPYLCSNLTLNIGNSRGVTTPAVMMVGLVSASVPTALGGTLLVIPTSVIPITLPAGGASLPVAVICDSALAGFAVYHQVLESDPGASQGVSFTPGLELYLGGVSPYF